MTIGDRRVFHLVSTIHNATMSEVHIPSEGKWDWRADAMLDYNYGMKAVDLGDKILKSYEMNRNSYVDHETCVPPDKYGYDECVPAAAQKPNGTHGRDYHARVAHEESSASARKSQAAQSFHVSDQCHFGTSSGGQPGPGISQSVCQSFGPGT